jgi:hypothetical protein
MSKTNEMNKNQKHQKFISCHSGVRCFQNWAIQDLDLHLTRFNIQCKEREKKHILPRLLASVSVVMIFFFEFSVKEKISSFTICLMLFLMHHVRVSLFSFIYSYLFFSSHFLNKLNSVYID